MFLAMNVVAARGAFSWKFSAAGGLDSCEWAPGSLCVHLQGVW